MSKPTVKMAEKLLDLYKGMSIWKVNLDALRERDKNARVMPIDKFDRLTENIKKDKRLESLPLCTMARNKGGNDEFLIISGHHRTRAARSAGVKEIFILVIDEELTKNQVISKQLAHNSLSGFDNIEILNELFNEIDDINEKLASGITTDEVKLSDINIKDIDVKFNFDYEPIYLLFLSEQVKNFESVLDKLESEPKKFITDKRDFGRFAKLSRSVSKEYNVRNMVSIFSTILELAEKGLKDIKKENIITNKNIDKK